MQGGLKGWAGVTLPAAPPDECTTRPPPLRTSVSAAVNSSSRGRVMAPVSFDAQAVGTRCSGVAAGGGEGEEGGGEGSGGGEGDPGGGGNGGEGEGGDGGDGGGEGEGDMTTPL